MQPTYIEDLTQVAETAEQQNCDKLIAKEVLARKSKIKAEECNKKMPAYA